jgi:hypothetical protein
MEMAVDPAVTAQAAFTVWGTSLVLFLVVLGVVAVLLTLILKTVTLIERVAGEIWIVGQGIANNTVHIPLLAITNRVMAQILAVAVKILGHATRIQAHAADCPGCPDCVLSQRR